MLGVGWCLACGSSDSEPGDGSPITPNLEANSVGPTTVNGSTATTGSGTTGSTIGGAGGTSGTSGTSGANTSSGSFSNTATGTTASGVGGDTSSSTASDGSGGVTAGGGTAGTGGDGEPGVRFVGRVDYSDPQAPSFAWSGSGVVAAFEGSSLKVSLDDASENEFTVLIDGELMPKLSAQAGARDYELASSLDPGSHRVELYRRTEASFGATRFLGFDFGAEGQLLAPPAAPGRLIEIIGDSISCGYGNEGMSATCGFSAGTENHYETYGAIAARELDADVVTVAWSGKGVIYNYGDDKNDPMPALYGRTLPDDPSSVWDFSLVPDAVVINLGTNDFSTDDDPSPADFQEAYLELLREVRSHYPEAFLLCTVGPLLYGQDLVDARANIDAAVEAFEGEGDTRVRHWEMDISNDDPGCDYHPSLATHRAMADALVEELRAELNW